MSKTIVVPDEDRRRLLAFTRANGEAPAARTLEINVLTLARALAGLGVQRSTAALIRMKLAEVAA